MGLSYEHQYNHLGVKLDILHAATARSDFQQYNAIIGDINFYFNSLNIGLDPLSPNYINDKK